MTWDMIKHEGIENEKNISKNDAHTKKKKDGSWGRRLCGRRKDKTN